LFSQGKEEGRNCCIYSGRRDGGLFLARSLHLETPIWVWGMMRGFPYLAPGTYPAIEGVDQT